MISSHRSFPALYGKHSSFFPFPLCNNEHQNFPGPSSPAMLHSWFVFEASIPSSVRIKLWPVAFPAGIAELVSVTYHYPGLPPNVNLIVGVTLQLQGIYPVSLSSREVFGTPGTCYLTATASVAVSGCESIHMATTSLCAGHKVVGAFGPCCLLIFLRAYVHSCLVMSIPHQCLIVNIDVA